jgi:hypothetical protein
MGTMGTVLISQPVVASLTKVNMITGVNIVTMVTRAVLEFDLADRQTDIRTD